MRIIALKALRDHWSRPGREDSEGPLRVWWTIARLATWSNPQQVKATFGNASIVGSDRIVFNIAGNKYRLIVRCDYRCRLLFVRFIGTHAEYDRIDASEV